MSAAAAPREPADEAARSASRSPTGRYQPLVAVAIALAAGIVADRYVPAPIWIWWLSAVAALCVWWQLWRRRVNWAALPLLVALAATGGTWHHFQWHLFRQDELGLAARPRPQPVALEVLAREPAWQIPAESFDPMRAIPRFDRTRLEVDVCAVRDGAHWIPARGVARLDVDGHLLGVQPGDRLRVFARMSAPRPASGPGQFDYANYLRHQRVQTILRSEVPDCVQVIVPAGWSPWSWIQRVRFAGDRLIWSRLQHARSGLAAALLLGIREELDREQTETFMETGTVHLLAISGLHVGMLAMVLFAGLRLGMLPRRGALVAIVLVVVAYALLSGAQAPVIRATVLVVIVCTALACYQRLLPFNALALAAIVVLAINPGDLFRAGPQLSFLAVATLSALAPWVARREELDPLDRLIERSRSWPVRAVRWCGRWSLRMLLASAAVWLVTAPLVMARFHLISPVGIVLNLFLWLPVAVALLSGFATLLCGWLLPPAAGWCAAVCDASLGLVDTAVRHAATWPGSFAWVAGPPGWWLVGFYGALACWLAGGRRWVAPRWSVTLLLVWVAAGLAAPQAVRQQEQLRCTFLPVGHGLAVLVELPDGRTLLYDAGQLGSPVSGARTIAAALWSHGIRHLDAVVISHSDIDHYNTLPELMRRFSVGVVYTSRVFREDRGAAPQALRRELKRRGVPIIEVRAGQELGAGPDCRLEVRHPPPLGVVGSDNANSVVLSIEYAGRRILLTGDLEPPGLNMLLADMPYDVDVLLAPHHGSRLSDPPGLADWSTPEWVIVSCGFSDDPEPVSRTYRQRGAQVYATVDQGAVTVRVTDESLDVAPWRKRAE